MAGSGEVCSNQDEDGYGYGMGVGAPGVRGGAGTGHAKDGDPHVTTPLGHRQPAAVVVATSLLQGHRRGQPVLSRPGSRHDLPSRHPLPEERHRAAGRPSSRRRCLRARPGRRAHRLLRRGVTPTRPRRSRAPRGSATATSRWTATAATTSPTTTCTTPTRAGRLTGWTDVTATATRRSRRSTSTWCSPPTRSPSTARPRRSPSRAATSWSSPRRPRSRRAAASRSGSATTAVRRRCGTAVSGRGCPSPTRPPPPASRTWRRGGSRPTTTRVTRPPST